MTSTIAITHNFETGHRLPHLAGKCQNLHGHSWNTTVTVSAPALDRDGVLVEFGEFKHLLRSWIDAHLDHGLMLGADDPLVPLLTEYGRVFVFNGQAPSASVTHGLAWPTVENVAVLLGRVAANTLDQLARAPEARVVHVSVQETAVNRAGWSA